MDGQLANLIALTSHGSAYLNGVDEDVALALQQTNSWLTPISKVTFNRHSGVDDATGQQVAVSIAEWLRLLESEKVSRLSYVPFAWDRTDVLEHFAAAHLNGVPMAIQAYLADGKFELWYPQWRLDRSDPEKPWSVEYRGLKAERDSLTPMPTGGFVRNRLADAVHYARRYATSEAFEQALAWLNAPEGTEGLHGDLLPPHGYSLAARQMLACAAQAHIFSGPGGWNDFQAADDNARRAHDTVGAQLYAAIKLGIAYGTNTQEFSALPAPQPRPSASR